MLLTRMSGQCGKAIVAAQVVGHMRVEVRERVLALDRVVRQPAAPRGADRDRAALARAHHHEADPGMRGERVEQLGMDVSRSARA